MAVGMPEANFQGASPNAHFLAGEMPAPPQLKRQWWQGTGASVVIHTVVLVLLLYAATHAKQIATTVARADKLDFIFLDQPGPGGGGGGGGNKMPEPPKKTEIPPPQKPAPVQPIPKPKDITPPPMQVNVPIVAKEVPQLPGVVANMPSSDSISLGPGTGTGAGGGKGTGIGTGTGSGIGEGIGGGTGGGVYQIGNGVTSPQLIHEVKPNYTGDAMRAKIQGVVEMEAVVRPDGSVDPGSLKITRSLDSTFGLDDEAKKAVRQWRFRPGMLRGQPVPVQVLVELTFTLR